MTSAIASYRHDMPKVKEIGVLLDNQADSIEVTIYPAYKGKVPPFSVPGNRMAATYIFDSSGVHQTRMYYDR